MTGWEIAALLPLFLVIYSYLLYPFALALLAGAVQLMRDVRYVLRKGDRRGSAQADRPDGWPEVAVIISAYNEEGHVAERIRNLLSLDYPADRIAFLLGSDGSSDRTAEILKSFDDPRLKAFVFERNRGKASVLNDLVSRAQAPLLVFSDANTHFAPDAIKQLVRHFDVAEVGGVSGELRLSASKGDNQDSLYWRVEQLLKFFEARLGGLLGANGAIYAIRREAWRELKPDTICDDFTVAMDVAAQGYRLVYDPTAWAAEDTPNDISDEYDRRVRIGIGNFQALFRRPSYLTRTSMATAFAYVSHKVLRWIAPHLVLVSWLVMAGLAQGSGAWRAALCAMTLGLLLAWASYRMSRSGRKMPSVMKLVAFLWAIHWAFLVASWRFARGDYRGSWRRSAR
jgi:cellulose synthase/poly-beta-1,6-N-acetylglucosamine synthase-like glycosyltransferase